MMVDQGRTLWLYKVTTYFLRGVRFTCRCHPHLLSLCNRRPVPDEWLSPNIHLWLPQKAFAGIEVKLYRPKTLNSGEPNRALEPNRRWPGVGSCSGAKDLGARSSWLSDHKVKVKAFNACEMGRGGTLVWEKEGVAQPTCGCGVGWLRSVFVCMREGRGDCLSFCVSLSLFLRVIVVGVKV